MSEPIKAGDLVVLLRGCCAQADEYFGHVHTVEAIVFTDWSCRDCGAKGAEVSAVLDSRKRFGRPLTWLRRIPPADERHGERREEELCA